MRKNIFVLALVTIVGISISYAQTKIVGVTPRQKEQKEKLSDLMKSHVVGWNYVDEGSKWIKWGNVDPIYEYKVFAELYAKPTELYEQDIPTRVYAGSVFIGGNLLAITSILEPFNKYTYTSDQKLISVTFYRNSIDLKTEKYLFSYADYEEAFRHKVYIDDQVFINEIYEFLKSTNNKVRFKTDDLHLKNGFVVKSMSGGNLSDGTAIYSYNYDEIQTEALEEFPKAPNGSEDLASYIQSKIKCQDEWEGGAACRVSARFIIEKDGTISDLVLKGGDFFAKEYDIVQDRWYYGPEWIIDQRIEGFNNQVARVIHSTKFIPGKKGGKPVRTYCEYNISYKVPKTVLSDKTSSSNSKGSESVKIDDVYNYDDLDVKPSFPGGEQKMWEFIGSNLKYPQKARESGIQGRVFVGFVVEADGAISNVEIVRGIGGGCDEEAVRVVKSMPQWRPGEYKGKFVRVSFMIPFGFRLN